MQQRHVRLLVAGLVVSAAGAGMAAGAASFAAAAAPASPATCAGAARLTVHGSGTAVGAPDLLTVQVGVAVTGSSASAALGQDNRDTTAVVHAFETGGVAAADLQTTGLSIQPQYGSPGGGGPQITGYQVTDTVTATIHDLARAGTVVDDVVGVGGDATRIDSLSLSVQQPAALQDQARTAAVHQAVSHAQAMAAAAGRHLGPICSVADQPAQQPSSPLVFGAAAPAGASGQAHLPVQVGTQSFTDHVTMVYALVP